MISDANPAHTKATQVTMNSTTSTLADPDRSNAPTPFLDPEKDRANVDMSDRSTRAPSTSDVEYEKGEKGIGGGDTDMTDTETVRDENVVDQPPADPAEEEYPTGFRLSMIVVALILAVFLVSLDLVSEHSQSEFTRGGFVSNIGADNRRHSYSQDH